MKSQWDKTCQILFEKSFVSSIQDYTKKLHYVFTCERKAISIIGTVGTKHRRAIKYVLGVWKVIGNPLFYTMRCIFLIYKKKKLHTKIY